MNKTMRDTNKAKKRLIDELAQLRRRIDELEKSETELKQTEEELRPIEWLLRKKLTEDPYKPAYGDLTKLSSSRLIQDLIGKDLLLKIAGDYLGMIGASGTVYEKNGDYALSLFSSGWCRCLDQASRNLCETADNREALASGRWLCRESCWTKASKVSIDTGQAVDIECQGGIRLYAIPIRAGVKIVGSMNFGYGDPPKDPGKLQEIAAAYDVSVEELLQLSGAYESRPPFLIEIAKRRLETSAQLLGEIIERKLAERELRLSERELKFRTRITDIILSILYDDIYGEVLKVLLESFDSEFGVFGYIDEEGAFVVPSMTRHIWDKCQVPNKTFVFPREKWGDSIWPRAIREKSLLYSNERSSLTPEGHIAITRNITAPIIHSGKVVGLFQVANKETEYDQEDLDLAQIYSDAIAPVLNARLQHDRKEKARKQAEERANHLNLMLRAIRNVNQLITQEKDRDRLLKGTCERLVEDRGYDNVWLALLDESGKLAAHAEAGLGVDFEPIVEILKRGESTYCTEKALPQSDVVTIGDPASTCADCPLAGNCAGRAVMTVRLEHQGKVYGLLTISGPKAFYGFEEEVSLFDELAKDISYALHGIELEEKRKKAEEELAESEKRFKNIFNSANDGIVLAAREERKFLLGNQAICEMLGYSGDEIKELGVMDIHPEESLPHVIEQFEKQARQEIRVAQDIPVKRKDGSVFYADINTTPIELAGKTYLMGIFHDITEHKRAEEKLKQYSENLEQMVKERTETLETTLETIEQARDRIDGILKSVGDGLIVTDTRNDVVLMNRAAEEMLGLRLSDAINRPIDYAIEDASLREKITHTLAKTTTGCIYDFKLPDDDPKQSRIMRARTSTIRDSKGNASGVVTLINDVTKEREIDRMKTEFISTAAHELRTPMTSIQGFSELLLTRDDLEGGDRQRYLKHINKQSINLASIVSDLLDITRIESGQGFTLNREWSSPCEILGRVVSEFEGVTDKHSFEVINPKDPVDLHIDREKMEQVVRNLISNAVKYSPDGGKIRISGEVRKDDFVWSFEDEGLGMTLEQAEKIFDKFYRADASNTATEGTGLGMSIVKYIVEAHGGEVWVKSEKNKGTKVSLTLPLNPG